MLYSGYNFKGEKMNKDYIVKFDNVNYLCHPEEKTNQKGETKKFNTVSYYNNDRGNLDFRFVNPEDHINLDLDQNFDFPVKDVFVNSMNMNKIKINAKAPLTNTTLHINMNNYFIDMANRLHADEKAFIQDLNKFLPTLTTADNQQMFRAVSFENMSYRFGTAIQSACQKAHIQSYGMISDETSREGFKVSTCAKNRVKRLNIKPVGLKQSKDDTLQK